MRSNSGVATTLVASTVLAAPVPVTVVSTVAPGGGGGVVGAAVGNGGGPPADVAGGVSRNMKPSPVISCRLSNPQKSITILPASV
jgi:hypothetical protein